MCVCVCVYDIETIKGETYTKCGNLPLMQQYGHLAPNFIRSSFLIFSIDKEVPRLLVTKGRRVTAYNSRFPIPRMKLKIPIVVKGFR